MVGVSKNRAEETVFNVARQLQGYVDSYYAEYGRSNLKSLD